MLQTFDYEIYKPDPSLSDFVESFWMLANHSDTDKEIVILPDGRIDLFFSYSAAESFHIVLLGLESTPTQTSFPPGTVIFAISLKLLAIEYLLDRDISDLVNEGQLLPSGFWGITLEDLNDFDHFCRKASDKIRTLIKQNVDDRKQKLFQLIYSSNGALTVQELSERVHWSSRQINRYFNQQFGLPLKAYCTILRFRASFQHIKEGKLFPELNFTDQAHFIKEIKRLSGVVPKELSKNKNDRFIQFSTLPKK
ncbi:helix-turn-helix domain-containing protein [Runella sp.]|uniref:helix-turn-helix domain-containing protein n=1 Tax=Runella sp. TaxID=1960881 RepID=UPI003D0B9432